MNTYKLPIHLIRQYLFCPRVVYFLEVLNIPKISPIWVKEGETHHKKQAELFKRRTLARFGLESAEFKSNVNLSHDEFDFYGICDGLIISDTHIYPVEIKLHGNSPTNAQKMQLIAYGILAEKKFGKIFDLGFILFEKNGKTVPIKINEESKLEVVQKVDEIIEMIKLGRLPYSSADEAKCTQCEFENYCNDRF
ncbi:MAG: CRISPR-associated protein Cas4 [Sulfurimonas sp.]|uniref:CRISPR-associated protein Cas4 n=1 Tax=Sulfurimonas sp. TaxID=2022749 RepID=UPI00260C02A8|nr:CRISPR-associated protein Cas4 [Sulfurimonas sp.]MDD2652864.1 CRISPR-associated protein Cas4 [Sulfurimonas sp.]MDD3450909.1 CRISPR-associated protein Cas4 [Sulfurimonas sp.]